MARKNSRKENQSNLSPAPPAVGRPKTKGPAEAAPRPQNGPGHPGASLPSHPLAKMPLSGKTVAIVGGLDRLQTSYTDCVTRLGGQCMFHTGKVKGSCRRLKQMVAGADMVVFMTSINSHNALSLVKDECKRCRKQFCPLRQTGSSSLHKALTDLSAEAPGPAL